MKNNVLFSGEFAGEIWSKNRENKRKKYKIEGKKKDKEKYEKRKNKEKVWK